MTTLHCSSIPAVHHAYDDAIAGLDRTARIEANIAAIRLARQLEEEDRAAAPEELAVLDRFTGWGGIAHVFEHRPDMPVPASLRDQLRDLLGEDEWHAAAAATLTAFHTPRRLASAIAGGLQHLGYDGGRLLDPGAGTGAMIAALPEDLRQRSQVTAVECNRTVAGIAQRLHPAVNVVADRLERSSLPDGLFDAAIGNLPFANVLVTDRRYRNLSPLLHDYMALRTVDLLRPGGIAILITSRGFLDKETTGVREAVRDRATLIAACRLPESAFHRHSRTRAVADVLVLQRRPELLTALEVRHRSAVLAGEIDWISTEALAGSPGAVPVNRYFAERPEHVLGTASVVSGPYGPTLSVSGERDDAVLADAVARLLRSLPTGIYGPASIHGPDGHAGAPTPTLPRPEGAPRHILGEGTGEVLRWGAAGYEALDLGPTDRARLAALLGLRDGLRQAIASQAEGSSAERAAARASLRARYASFTAQHGWVRDRRNGELLAGDPDYKLLSALEVPTLSGYREADILHRDTGTTLPGNHPVSTIDEAIAVSLDRAGRVDLGLVARLLDLATPEQAAGLAGDRLYFDPAAAEWVLADEYLSGDVRGKLETARAAAAADASLERNVRALEAALPPAVGFTDIEAAIGATWIAQADYEAFAASLLTDAGDPRPVCIARNPVDASYAIHTVDRARHLVQATQTWGTDRRPFHHLLDNLLNNTPIVVRDRLEDGSHVVNLVATEDAQAKAREIEEAWRDWIWSDPARRDRLAARYNELMNREVPPRFDGSHLTLPGLAETWRERVRPVQRDAVWRVIRHGAALIGHEMSVGKTLTLVIAAMEARRLGRARRPLLAVKKANLDEIVGAAREYYPDAHILALPDGATAAERHEFLGLLATGEVDLAITSHDAFDRIAISPATESAVIAEQIADHRIALQALDEDDPAGRRTVKQIAAAIERLEARLETLAGHAARDDVVTYEDLAVDLLLVDEAHRYKALPVVTRDTALKGVPRGESKRALHLLMAARVTAEVNRRAGRRSRGLVLATGTPVTNTIPEVFTLQRYLQPEILDERGLAHFDAWVRVFGQAETRLEMSVAGDYRLTTRLCRFVNLAELARMVSPLFDVVFAEDVKDLRRPKRNVQAVPVPATPALASVMAWLRDRANSLSASSNDNMLSISSDGRKAALDPRLVLAPDSDNAGGKLAAAAVNIARIARDNPGSVQLVFMDIGLHGISTTAGLACSGDDDAEVVRIARRDAASGTAFSARAELIRLLAGHGVAGHRVCDVLAVEGKARRAAIRALRTGRAAVGIGSTETLGTGHNVQDRIVAVHHIDAPWLPASLEQRDARGVRHGNLNDEVFVYRYVTVGSFDAFMWQVLDTKTRFIRAFLDACRGRGLDGLVREIRNDDAAVLSPGEVMAIAAGNPILLRRAELQDRVKRLERSRQRAERVRQEAGATVGRLAAELAGLRGEIPAARAAAADAGRLTLQPFVLELPAMGAIDALVATKRAEAAAELDRRITALETAVLHDLRRREDVPIAARGAFAVLASVIPHGRRQVVTDLVVSHRPSGAVLRRHRVSWHGADRGAGAIASLDRQVSRFTDLPARLEIMQRETEQDLETATALTRHRFADLADLQDAREALARIERMLSLPAPDPEAVDAVRRTNLGFAELDALAARLAERAMLAVGEERQQLLAEAAAHQAVANERDPDLEAQRSMQDRVVEFPQPSRALLDRVPDPDDAPDAPVAQELLDLFSAA